MPFPTVNWFFNNSFCWFTAGNCTDLVTGVDISLSDVGNPWCISAMTYGPISKGLWVKTLFEWGHIRLSFSWALSTILQAGSDAKSVHTQSYWLLSSFLLLFYEILPLCQYLSVTELSICCVPKTSSFSFFKFLSQKVTDFNDCWCVKSWENLTPIACTFAHLIWIL